ncbi:MAG TPA: type II secretion system F family protein [Gammaproteobacteria bacterium]|nr:type II secretion system F family protein [Gammaproteobacteria bacterium]
MTISNELWIVIGAVFAAVFLLSQAMIVPVFGESRKTRKRLRARLGEIERELGQNSFASILREKYLRELSPLERTLESLPMMAGITDMIEQAGYTMLAHRLALLSVGAGIIGAAVAWTVTHSWPLAVLALVACGAAPFLKVANARTKRILKIEEQLPEAVDMMKRALRAGHPFSGAVKLVSEELEAPLGKEFATTFADLNYGNDVRRAMLGLLQRIPSVAVMALVTSVLVQKETGGNLAEILGQISAVVRGRFKLERKIRTLSAEGRLSAWILALVPLVLFIVISLTTPDYLPTLTKDEFGKKLIVFGAVSGVIGILWIRKIIRIDV